MQSHHWTWQCKKSSALQIHTVHCENQVSKAARTVESFTCVTGSVTLPSCERRAHTESFQENSWNTGARHVLQNVLWQWEPSLDVCVSCWTCGRNGKLWFFCTSSSWQFHWFLCRLLLQSTTDNAACNPFSSLESGIVFLVTVSRCPADGTQTTLSSPERQALVQIGPIVCLPYWQFTDSLQTSPQWKTLYSGQHCPF